MDITQEMLDRAAEEEGNLMAQSPEVLQAQNRALQQRVILLRAAGNEQERIIAELKAKYEPEETPAETEG